MLNLCVRPIMAIRQRNGQQFVERRDSVSRDFFLPFENIDMVIVDRMQCSRRRAWYPGSIGTGHRMADFLFHHVGHHVRRRPHAFADLCLAGHAASQTDGDIALFISGDPVALLDIALGEHSPCLHRRVDFVTRTVEEAGIDEHNPVLHRVDTGREIGGRAAFLVHHADLDGMTVQSQQIFHRIEKVVGESAFFRPVHFWLHDIDGSGATVAQLAQSLDIVHRDQAGEHAIEQSFRRFRSVGQQNGRVGHQMPDIADKHQAAARQGESIAIRIDIVTIRVGLALDRLAALFEGCIKIAAHQAKPVAIGKHLVLGIHRRDGIFHVDDRGQCRFHQDVGDMGRIILADRVCRIDHDFGVQSVMLEQQGPAVAANQLRRIGQGELTTGIVGP